MVRPCRFSTLYEETARLYLIPRGHVRYRAGTQAWKDIGCIHLAPLPGVYRFHADIVLPVLQRPDNQTHQSTNDEEILRQEEYVQKLFLEATKSEKRDPDQNVSLWVKYFVVTYI